MDPNREVQDVLERLVKGGETGLQVAACLDGKLVIDAWAGLADPATGRHVDGDTLFTAFSMSKGIVSVCVHLLADRGLLDYDEPVARYWPEFAAHGKDTTTVRDALMHRTGIPQDPPGLDLAQDWDTVCSAIAALEPLWPPGSRTGYHPLTYGWILGEVVRRIDGRPLSRFLHEEVCAPLGIEDLYFGVPPAAEQRVATVVYAPGLGPIGAAMLNPSLADSAGTFNRPEVRRAAIPGAGAIVNARSLARLYAMLACDGELDGRRLLSRERVAVASLRQVEAPVAELPSVSAGSLRWWSGHGLGFTLGGGPGPAEHFPGAFGYEGLGTIAFADRSQRYAFAFAKNQLDWSEREMHSVTEVAQSVERALDLVP